MIFDKNKKNKGFTLVESLVAISILVMSIIGATAAIQTGLSSHVYAKNQIIAFYLAQEAFEYIRNIRDENGLNGQNWLTDLGPCTSGEVCIIDAYVGSPPQSCNVLGCPQLRQDPTNGYFGYNSGWTETDFRREIRISVVDSKEFSVEVTVDWSKGLIQRQFRARENLLNWR